MELATLRRLRENQPKSRVEPQLSRSPCQDIPRDASGGIFAGGAVRGSRPSPCGGAPFKLESKLGDGPRSYSPSLAAAQGEGAPISDMGSPPVVPRRLLRPIPVRCNKAHLPYKLRKSNLLKLSHFQHSSPKARRSLGIVLRGTILARHWCWKWLVYSMILATTS